MVRLVSPRPGFLAIMATAGLYDDSGQWLYHTRLPEKGGVVKDGAKEMQKAGLIRR